MPPTTASSKFTVLEGHADRVSDLAWLPDGRLATVSFDNTIKLWDTTAAKVLQTLPRQSDLLFAVAAHPDGQRLATGGKDRLIRIWDLGSTDAPKELTSSSKSVLRLCFSLDGKWLASCGEDDTRVSLWDVAQAKSVKQFNCEDPDDKNQRRSLFSIAFSADGKQLASGGADRTVRLWDVEAGKETRRFEAAEYAVFKEKDKKVERDTKKAASEFAVYAVAFSPDGKLLASGGLDKTILLWDVSTGELKQAIASHVGFVQALQFTSENRLFSCGHSGHLALWDIATGQSLWTAKLPVLASVAVLAPDVTRAAAAGSDGKAYVIPLP